MTEGFAWDAALSLVRWQRTRRGYDGDAELLQSGFTLLEPDADGQFGPESALSRAERAFNLPWARVASEILQFAVFLVTKAKRDEELRPQQTRQALRLLQLSLNVFANIDSSVQALMEGGKQTQQQQVYVNVVFGALFVFQELQKTQTNKKKQEVAGVEAAIQLLDQIVEDALFDAEHIRQYDGAVVYNAVWMKDGDKNGAAQGEQEDKKSKKRRKVGGGKAASGLVSYQKNLFDELLSLLVDKEVPADLKASVGGFFEMLQKAEKNEFLSVLVTLYNALFRALCACDVYRVTEDTEEREQFQTMEKVLSSFLDVLEAEHDETVPGCPGRASEECEVVSSACWEAVSFHLPELMTNASNDDEVVAGELNGAARRIICDAGFYEIANLRKAAPVSLNAMTKQFVNDKHFRVIGMKIPSLEKELRKHALFIFSQLGADTISASLIAEVLGYYLDIGDNTFVGKLLDSVLSSKNEPRDIVLARALIVVEALAACRGVTPGASKEEKHFINSVVDIVISEKDAAWSFFATFCEEYQSFRAFVTPLETYGCLLAVSLSLVSRNLSEANHEKAELALQSVVASANKDEFRLLLTTIMQELVAHEGQRKLGALRALCHLLGGERKLNASRRLLLNERKESIVTALLQNFAVQSLESPDSSKTANALLQMLVEASTSSEYSQFCSEWSSNLARLYGYMKEHDVQLRKHVVYLLMTFLVGVTRDKLAVRFQQKLRPGVFALLDVCSPYEKEQLFGALDSTGKTLLKTLDTNYKLTHRYVGKV
eukprot:jgi/Phyca11/535709/estExt2_fgenesh1_pg.C_PHYCAscaffold_400083